MKTKKVLFVTDASCPNLTMNGIVIKNLIDCLSEDYKISIISLKQRYNDTSDYKDIKIKYVKPLSYLIYSLREKRLQARSQVMSSVYGFTILFIRIFSISQRILSKTGLHDPLVNDLKKAIDVSLNAEYEYVVLIGKPFEAFAAALPLIKKYRKVKFIAYQVDNFVTGEDINYPKILLGNRNRARVRMLNNCSKHFWRYFMTESVYSKEKSYLQNKKSIKIIGLPLIKNQRKNVQPPNNNNKCGNVKLVYAGSLLRGFRPPEDCLDILIELAQMIDMHIDFYQRGDCDDILNTYSGKSNGAVINHGTVSSDKAYEAVNSADVLIAISNFAGDQISGKTFDCISTGKPVIFFYYQEEDYNLEFFQKYQLGLCIKMSPQKVMSNAETICKFIIDNRNHIVSYDEIEKEFWNYTPQYIANKIFQETAKKQNKLKIIKE